MLFKEAEDWVLDTNSDWLFSFSNVCETLGFSPEYLRQGLAQWKAAKQESRARAKVYRLAPRNGKRKRGIAVTGRSRQRLRRVASR
jgi:hypothetical protein